MGVDSARISLYVGIAGIAPFLVVDNAPAALANFKAFDNDLSSGLSGSNCPDII